MTIGLFAAWQTAAAAATPPADAAPPSPGIPPQQEQLPQQPLYKSIWRENERQDILNLQSGLSCDARAAGFVRVGIYAYKPAGTDISCNYAGGTHSLITIYLTRRDGRGVADDFAEAKRELLSMQPALADLAAPNADATLSGIAFSRAFYTRGDRGTREGIWIGDLDGWTLEYRATWVTADENAVFAAVDALTARAKESAGTRLALCAKAPPPVRDGTLVTDKDAIGAELMMQSLLGAVAPAAEKSGATAVKAPAAWCADDLIGPSGTPLLLWHGVFGDGSDASVDRVTPASVDEPWILEGAPNAMSDLAQSSSGKAPAKPRWTVSIHDGKQVWIYALYDGRPGGADLGKLAGDIAAGKAKAIGGYKADGKSLTINMPDSH